MMQRPALWKFSLTLVALAVLCVTTPAFRAADALPAQISDDLFWRMVTEMSEPDGYFQFENFISNEHGFQFVIPRLKQLTKPGGVYLGVGPEQNFTYIAAMQPKMAFIIDIRRQNMLELLMYKALFEMSPDRADFLSHLFARKRPAGLDARSTPAQLFKSYGTVRTDEELYKQNIEAIRNLLVKTHGFALTPKDLQGSHSIDYVYRTFVRSGPNLDYSVGGPFAGDDNPTYEDLMTMDDGHGVQWSFLATERNYQFLRELERKNLIVPLVGDLAGGKTIRAVGKYLKDHNGTVSAFYLSNVEQYLFQSSAAVYFFTNVSMLPLDSTSTFIRTFGGGSGLRGVFRFQSMLSSMTEMLTEFREGRIRTYQDVRDLSR
jgi:hypothetical protein